MRGRALQVADFPGSVMFFEDDNPTELRKEARAVVLPEAWKSSRSYRLSYALVGVGPTRVGVDLEVLDSSVGADAVLTRGEQSLGGSSSDWCVWWSAKEALAKALGNARNYDPRRLDSPALWRNGREGRWVARRVMIPEGLIVWVVWEREPAVDRD